MPLHLSSFLVQTGGPGLCTLWLKWRKWDPEVNSDSKQQEECGYVSAAASRALALECNWISNKRRTLSFPETKDEGTWTLFYHGRDDGKPLRPSLCRGRLAKLITLS